MIHFAPCTFHFVNLLSSRFLDASWCASNHPCFIIVSEECGHTSFSGLCAHCLPDFAYLLQTFARMASEQNPLFHVFKLYHRQVNDGTQGRKEAAQQPTTLEITTRDRSYVDNTSTHVTTIPYTFYTLSNEYAPEVERFRTGRGHSTYGRI